MAEVKGLNWLVNIDFHFLHEKEYHSLAKNMPDHITNGTKEKVSRLWKVWFPNFVNLWMILNLQRPLGSECHEYSGCSLIKHCELMYGQSLQCFWCHISFLIPFWLKNWLKIATLPWNIMISKEVFLIYKPIFHPNLEHTSVFLKPCLCAGWDTTQLCCCSALHYVFNNCIAMAWG